MKKQLFWGLVALTIFVGFLVHKDKTSAQDKSGNASGSDAQSATSATVLAAWSFEGVTTSATPGTTPSVTVGSAAADSGAQTAGSAFTGSHASASTVWSTPTGNGSAKCISSQQWAVNDYYQFLFNTSGFTAISITWDERGSNTGPRDFKVQYSTNGTTFIDATGVNSTVTIANDTWSAATPNAASTRTLDLSGVAALNNQPTVYIRLVDNSAISVTGGAVGTSGTDAVDNFIVSGTNGAPTPTPAPAVTNVNPNSGTTAGGTSVTITGTNFTGATAVSFGGTAAAGFTATTATSISATAPAHAAGTVDVTVTTTGGTSAVSASDQYTFTAAATPTPTPAPAVSGVSPNSGSTAGGTSVAITGTNFSGATAVKFGTTAATTFTVNSATSITATSPAHAAGAVDMTVTTSGGTSATSASDQFTYTTAAPTPTPIVQHVVDFDGDGKTDYSVIRNNGPSVPMTWWNLGSQSGALLNKDFGDYTLDFQEPADYDNDGHTDVAVWRPPNAGNDAMWFILQSSDGTAKATQFGSEGDNPDVVGDYDGDGKADIAVYRADLNTHLCTWWFRPSSGPLAGQNIPLQWGIAPDVDDIDIPVPGDYNHDGKADMAVARPSASGQATVWIHQGDGTANINTVNTAQPWGHYATGDLTNADAYVPGDYDADGKTDLAIARVVGTQWQWWIQWSSDGSIHVVTWGAVPAAGSGQSPDALVQGDYDGDGKTDIAVWRPLEGNFYVLSSKTGTPIVKQWGNGSTDIPTANFNAH